MPGTRWIAGWKGPLPRVVDSTIEGSPGSRSANCRPMRSALGSVAKSNRPFGSLLPLKSGLAAGLRLLFGKRSFRNTLTLFRDLCARSNGNNVPLIATDGFQFYRQVVRRLFGAACLYGQVIKKRRNDRVVRVQRKARLGAAWRWNELWRDSEDSRQLNTSYIERLNLTIRQGSAYLCRRSLCHARRKQRLWMIISRFSVVTTTSSGLTVR